MFGVKTIRKLLLTAVVAALATTPVAAESSMKCDYFDVYGDPKGGHLSCPDGQIQVCRDKGDNCAVSCGNGFVAVGKCVQPPK